MKTFATFLADVRAKAFPEGEAENLVTAHNTAAIDALIQLQTYVRCLQERHVDIHPQCSTYFRCGVTVIDAPDGEVSRVYTVHGNKYCSRLHYLPVEFEELDGWSRRFFELVAAPENAGLPSLKFSYKYPEATTDSDYGRALFGLWTIKDDKIFLAPWLQSTESMVVEWAGVKKAWGDNDPVLWTPDVERAVRLFLKKDRPEDFPDGLKMAKKWSEEYAEAMGDLCYRCDRKMRVPERKHDHIIDMESVLYTEASDNPNDPLGDAETSDDDWDADTKVALAVIGNYGSGSDDAEEVANLVRSQEISAIVTTGNNHNNQGDFDPPCGALYSPYIAPFKGSPLYGASAGGVNRFWPAIGPLDYITGALTKFNDYFTLPNNGRYYEFINGPFHFFVLNSNAAEPDGISYTSVQAAWFQKRIALATLPWKIVVLHHAPYTSDVNDTPGNTTMRWPFDKLGVSMVLSGSAENYERLVVDDVQYVNVGTGGMPLTDFAATPLTESEESTSEFGALFLTADCDKLELEFVDTENNILDSLELES